MLCINHAGNHAWPDVYIQLPKGNLGYVKLGEQVYHLGLVSPNYPVPATMNVVTDFPTILWVAGKLKTKKWLALSFKGYIYDPK